MAVSSIGVDLPRASGTENVTRSVWLQEWCPRPESVMDKDRCEDWNSAPPTPLSPLLHPSAPRLSPSLHLFLCLLSPQLYSSSHAQPVITASLQLHHQNELFTLSHLLLAAVATFSSSVAPSRSSHSVTIPDPMPARPSSPRRHPASCLCSAQNLTELRQSCSSCNLSPNCSWISSPAEEIDFE